MSTETDTSILDQLAEHAGSLYSLPAVALEVLQLTNSPKVDVRALKERIECDPALTTKILRTVNSAVFGLSGEVSDLNQAIALLGIKALKMLALGFSLPPAIFEGIDKEVLLHYWRHTLTRSVACRELCKEMRSTLGDETFIAALLQDLGVLVLIQELGEPYSQLYRRASDDNYDLATLEYRATGFDHTQLTGRLLRSWSLPETLVNTIDTSPHIQMPLSPEVMQQRSILEVAEKIALVLADGRSGELSETLQLASEKLRVTDEKFFNAMSRIEELVLQLGDILSLQLPDGLGYDELLTQARDSMAQVSSTLQENLTKKDLSPEEYALLESELQTVSKTLEARMAQKATQPEPSKTPQQPTPSTPTKEQQQPVTDQASLKGPHQAPSTESYSQPSQFLSTFSHYDLLLDRVGKAISVCRQRRFALSLLVADVILCNDRGPTDDAGVTQRRTLLDRLLGNARNDLDQACTTLDHPFHLSCPFGENGIAVVLLDCERNDAIRLAEDLLAALPKEYNAMASHRMTGQEPGIRLGVGIASASSISSNFQAKRIIEGATRCLHAALTSAGRPIKSIEVF